MSEINVPNLLNWRPYTAYTCNCENQSIVKNKLVDNKKCPRTTAICWLNIFYQFSEQLGLYQRFLSRNGLHSVINTFKIPKPQPNVQLKKRF